MAVHPPSSRFAQADRRRRLRPGIPAAHENADVPLLPSGPGGVGQILVAQDPALVAAHTDRRLRDGASDGSSAPL